MIDTKELKIEGSQAPRRSPFTYYLLISVGGVFILASYICWKVDFDIKRLSWSTVERKSASSYAGGGMHMAVSICGDRLEEGIVMLKSVTLLTRPSPFHVHIFASDDLKASITKELNSWPMSFRNNMSYTLHPVKFPNVSNEDVWRSLFRPCASQRLFLPLILTDVDAVLYVDSDVVFLRPLDDIWQIFKKFNVTQIAALTPETETPDGNWYLRHTKIPKVPPYGINTGVVLMNATRIRQVDWLSNLTSLYQRYKSVMELGDQDLVNIYFTLYPQRLYLMECQWNYRSDHCAYNSNCKSSKATGVSIIHGNRAIFHTNRHPIFREIFKTFQDYRFDKDPEKFFNKRMLEILLNLRSETKCEQVAKIFLQQLHVNMLRTFKELRKTL